MSDSPTHVGVDTGGTFTDVVARHADGGLTIHKVLSTPDDPSRAILEGVRALGAGAARLVHGSTVATNAVLERRGARVCFIVTQGFEDILELKRQNRTPLYSQRPQVDAPLVARIDVHGLPERVDFSGRVLEELSESAIETVVALAQGYPAVAVCLLHAYANPHHENRVVEALRSRYPTVHISASHEVLNEFREYERACATVINAYVGPIMASYLGRLADAMVEPVDVIQSNGGRFGIDVATRLPVNTILSGPAGGVVGAWTVAQELGISKIIGFDMGGTSTDVSLCDGGLAWTKDSVVDGLPLRVPVLDIHTVGAGGGSIAWRDTGGALRVGPRSAGSSPGPACYPDGGSSFTVTDANLVLGRLPTSSLLAGRMPLSLAAAKTAGDMAGAEHGVTGVELAEATLRIANAAMVRAIKVISVERGHDPRAFSLVSFGGAGGLHACELAEELGIDRVVVPRMPGLLSAFGMLSAPQLRTASMTVLRALSTESLRDVDLKLGQLEASLREELPNAELTRSLACRYRGQSFELDIDWALEPDAIVQAFTALHVKAYGYHMDREIEVVNARAVATLRSTVSFAPESVAPREAGVQEVVGVGCVDVLPRTNVGAEAVLVGPVIITEMSSTTWVPPGWSVRERLGHLVLERQ